MSPARMPGSGFLLPQRRRLVLRGARLLIRLATRTTVHGRSHLPDGPALLICNHLSHLDPVFVFSALRDPPQIVALATLTRAPIAPLVYFFRPLLVHRDQVDRAVIRGILECLAAGRQVLLYPEARISLTGGLEPARAGVGLIALQSGVPVVPIALSGSERVCESWRSGRRPLITMRIGTPYHATPNPELSGREQRRLVTEQMMTRLAALLPAAYRGIYSGTNSVQD